MTRRKVLIACDYKLKTEIIGGMDRFYWEFDKILKANDFEVKWCFPKDSHHEDVRYKELSISLPDNINFVWGIEEVIKEFSPDIIITHFVPFFNKFNKQWKQYGNPTIIAVDHMSRPIGGYTFIQKMKLKAKGLAYRNSIDGILSVSNFVKQQVQKEYCGQVLRFPLNEVVYNGVDLSIYSKTSHSFDPDNIRLVSVGNVTQSKGFHLLIEALGRLKQKNKQENYYLDIIGDGPYMPILKELSKKHSLQQVNFLGALNNAYELLPNYNISVQPSLWQENFPFTIIESFISGLPVLASNTGGLPELINEQRGWFFKQASVEDLMEKLDALRSLDSAKVRLMSDYSATFVEKELSLNNMVEGHFNFMLQVIDK